LFIELVKLRQTSSHSLTIFDDIVLIVVFVSKRRLGLLNVNIYVALDGCSVALRCVDAHSNDLEAYATDIYEIARAREKVAAKRKTSLVGFIDNVEPAR